MNDKTEQKRGRRGPKPSGNARLLMSVRIKKQTLDFIDDHRCELNRGHFIDKVIEVVHSLLDENAEKNDKNND